MSQSAISRRLFLESTVAGGALLSLATPAALALDESGKPAAGKIGDFKISLAEWSLHRALFAKKIDNLDFPKLAREDYGIDGVELLRLLSEKERAALVLRDLEGLTTEETARVLGSSEATVRSQISKARAKVHDFVERYFSPRKGGRI